jgi:hypothetical protein
MFDVLPWICNCFLEPSGKSLFTKNHIFLVHLEQHSDLHLRIIVRKPYTLPSLLTPPFAHQSSLWNTRFLLIPRQHHALIYNIYFLFLYFYRVVCTIVKCRNCILEVPYSVFGTCTFQTDWGLGSSPSRILLPQTITNSIRLPSHRLSQQNAHRIHKFDEIYMGEIKYNRLQPRYNGFLFAFQMKFISHISLSIVVSHAECTLIQHRTLRIVMSRLFHWDGLRRHVLITNPTTTVLILNSL